MHLREGSAPTPLYSRLRTSLNILFSRPSPTQQTLIAPTQSRQSRPHGACATVSVHCQRRGAGGGRRAVGGRRIVSMPARPTCFQLHNCIHTSVTYHVCHGARILTRSSAYCAKLTAFYFKCVDPSPPLYTVPCLPLFVSTRRVAASSWVNRAGKSLSTLTCWTNDQIENGYLSFDLVESQRDNLITMQRPSAHRTHRRRAGSSA